MPCECLSGRELECVARESAGISPLAAQQTAAKARPSTESGSAQNTHTHTHGVYSNAATVSLCGCLKEIRKERESAHVRVSVCDGDICFSDDDAVGVFLWKMKHGWLGWQRRERAGYYEPTVWKCIKLIHSLFISGLDK